MTLNMNKRKPGGGRKPEYNEPTDTIAFRVPISHKERIKNIVKEELQNIKDYIDHCKTEEYNFKEELRQTHKPTL